MIKSHAWTCHSRQTIIQLTSNDLEISLTLKFSSYILCRLTTSTTLNSSRKYSHVQKQF